MRATTIRFLDYWLGIPRLFAPLSSSIVIWKELACSPCVSVFNHRLSPCSHNVCMLSITVDEVFDAVRTAVAVRA
jgi:hypothetical protein